MGRTHTRAAKGQQSIRVRHDTLSPFIVTNIVCMKRKGNIITGLGIYKDTQ